MTYPTVCVFSWFSAIGAVTSSNGLMFGGTKDDFGPMWAFDASNGDILWEFLCGESVAGELI